MRITGGTFRSRVLKAPIGRTTRPTSDKVRQALFNILHAAPWSPDMVGLSALDMFAGTGALGLEALSRGAAQAVFIDTDDEALQICRKNAQSLSVEDRCFFLKKPGKRPASINPVSLVFMDPPYGKDLAKLALSGLQDGGWLEDRAVIVLEERKNVPLPEALHILDQRLYGDTQLIFSRL